MFSAKSAKFHKTLKVYAYIFNLPGISLIFYTPHIGRAVMFFLEPQNIVYINLFNTFVIKIEHVPKINTQKKIQTHIYRYIYAENALKL